MAYLTVREIIDLAKYVGIEIIGTPMPDQLEDVVCVMPANPEGMENDDGEIEYYHLIAYFEDYPEKGVCPLGEPKAFSEIYKKYERLSTKSNKESPAQQEQHHMIGALFFKGEKGQKLKVMSTLNSDNGITWFLTYDPVTGCKFRNEIKVFEI